MLGGPYFPSADMGIRSPRHSQGFVDIVKLLRNLTYMIRARHQDCAMMVFVIGWQNSKRLKLPWPRACCCLPCIHSHLLPSQWNQLTETALALKRYLHFPASLAGGGGHRTQCGPRVKSHSGWVGFRVGSRAGTPFPAGLSPSLHLTVAVTPGALAAVLADGRAKS